MMQECYTAPGGKETKLIAKTLSALQLDARAPGGLKFLRLLTDKIIPEIPEKDKCVTLHRFSS
jgi:hypothetical protein